MNMARLKVLNLVILDNIGRDYLMDKDYMERKLNAWINLGLCTTEEAYEISSVIAFLIDD